MSNRSAEIEAAYAAATPGLGAGHALEARLIGPAAYAARLAAARDAVNDAGLDAVLLGFGADMRYLTGYAAPALERLTMLVIPANGAPSLIVPRLEAVRKVEPCPRCGESMLLGRSAHGWWFRCVATGCSGKRDLGNEPGRAVEFLTCVAEIPKQAPPTVSGASTGRFRGL